ncbi:MAG: tetratricopeptide repeat protein, partial [Catalinimonas sp.]
LQPLRPAALPTADRTEYYYRLGRVHHRMGHPEPAVAAYERALDAPAGANTYLAANASLQLGYLWWERGDTTRARRAFERALTYRGHAYERGIDSKARAALRQLR